MRKRARASWPAVPAPASWGGKPQHDTSVASRTHSLTHFPTGFLTALQASSATGAVAWAVQIGGADDDIAYDVAVSPSGDAAYVAGSFRSQCQFGSGASAPLKTSRGEYDGFVAKARAPASGCHPSSQGRTRIPTHLHRHRAPLQPSSSVPLFLSRLSLFPPLCASGELFRVGPMGVPGRRPAQRRGQRRGGGPAERGGLRRRLLRPQQRP